MAVAARSQPLDADSRRDAGRALRAAVRAGAHDGLTTGLAPGMVQANLVVLPADWAAEFERYRALNPKPCPLLAMTAPGDPMLAGLGEGIDIRTDAPRYNVFRDGVLTEEATDISGLWRDDFVGFALGCSYSFEEALLSAGLPLRHHELGVKVPLYLTDIETEAAGPFHGRMVVSMRPFNPADAIRAIAITARCEKVHGAPVHFGDPAAIGIPDIEKPWLGPAVPFRPGEVPLFWACGVTPQMAIEQARPPLAITHKPGHMLITDMLNAELAA
ncbi:MAG: putative hydro-lyase [Alphaproteobacteria bacterium]|nr:putative hydro-lyase [Alphaproteobacteria bacterium]